jgi:histidyl-tRNA synthetase
LGPTEDDLTKEAVSETLGEELKFNREIFTRIESDRPELSEAIVSLMGLEGKSAGFLRNLKALFGLDIPGLAPAIDNFVDIVELLDDIGCPYQIDMASGRGFEYYTGVIFHLFSGEDKIGGGGRYDDLIPLMGGGDVPASGFALYFDCLMDLVNPNCLTGSQAQTVMVRAGRKVVKEGFNIAGDLRKAGYSVQLWLEGQEMPDVRWILDICDEPPLFLLHDTVTGEDFELETRDKVLTQLGEGYADKNSPA